MKKILFLSLIIALSLGASAQHRISGYRHYPRTRVVVSAGIPFNYGYGYYNPYYAPSYRYSQRESRLDLQIEDIKADYQDRIWSARHDKSLSRSERKRTIHELKRDRDQAVIDAKRNYYRQPR